MSISCSENNKYEIYSKISPGSVALFHADGRTDMSKASNRFS